MGYGHPEAIGVARISTVRLPRQFIFMAIFDL
jgi:hypothetical protein